MKSSLIGSPRQSSKVAGTADDMKYLKKMSAAEALRG